MKFELEIHSADDLQAFSVFLASAADTRRQQEAEVEAGRVRRLAAVGTIATRPAQQDAEEPEPATPTAPAEPVVTSMLIPEKKTRSRKAKDAPASSVSSDDRQTFVVPEGHEVVKDAEGRAVGTQPAAAISTGEERVGPEDDAAVAEQDAADEKAETEATKTGLTLDDVRNELGVYVKLFGMDAAQADGPVVITKVCGEGKVKMSDITDDKVAAVVSGVREMIAKNPFGRQKVAA